MKELKTLKDFEFGYIEALDDLLFYISLLKSYKAYRFLWEDEIIRMIKSRKSNVLKNKTARKKREYGFERIEEELGITEEDLK